MDEKATTVPQLALLTTARQLVTLPKQKGPARPAILGFPIPSSHMRASSDRRDAAAPGSGKRHQQRTDRPGEPCGPR